MRKTIYCLTIVMLILAVLRYAGEKEQKVFGAVYPKRMDITDVYTLNGTIREKERKDIYLEKTSLIVNIRVKEGDIVNEGDIVALVEPGEGVSLSIPSEYVINAVLRGETGEAVYMCDEEGYIRSPASGTIMSIYYNEGDKAGPVLPLFTVSDLDQLKVSAQINEDSIHKIKEGMNIEIYSHGDGESVGKGVVTGIKPYAVSTVNLLTNKSNPARTGIEIDVTDKAENMKPGHSVTMKLVTDTRENALTIPYEYIKQNDENEQYVYVLGADGHPEIRKIETGYELETVCEVRSGLSENDLLLMHNEEQVDYVAIRVKNAEQ